MSPQEAHDWCFTQGWRVLARLYHWEERQCRKIVGRWIKDHGPQLAQRALVGIDKHKPLEPVSWATEGFKAIELKNAWKRTSGRIRAPDVPIVPDAERVKPERVQELLRQLKGM